MPKINDLIATLRRALRLSDAGAALDPRDRMQNQLAHGRLGFSAAAQAAPVLAALGAPAPVAWSALAPALLWLAAEAAQLRTTGRWTAAQAWDAAADLAGWLSGWAVLAMLAQAGAVPGWWMAAAGALALLVPVAVGGGYWLHYGPPRGRG